MSFRFLVESGSWATSRLRSGSWSESWPESWSWSVSFSRFRFCSYLKSNPGG